MIRGQQYADAAPVTTGLADILLSILERGIVVAIRLTGPPGDRRLVVGFGTPGAIDPILLALGMTSGVFGRRDGGYDEYGDWMQ